MTLSPTTAGALEDMSLEQLVSTIDTALPGFAPSFKAWITALCTIASAYEVVGYPAHAVISLAAEKMAHLEASTGDPHWYQQIDLFEVCKAALPAMVASRATWHESDAAKPREMAPKVAHRKALSIAAGLYKAQDNAPAIVTVERQAGLTPNDMATIIRAIRESPVEVNVKVDHRAAPRDAIVMRDDEGNVVGVRTVPIAVETTPEPDGEERLLRPPTMQEDLNATAQTVMDLSHVPFAPVQTQQGNAAPRGILPGKASKVDRMRDLAKSSDPEVRNDARAWLRKRNIPEDVK